MKITNLITYLIFSTAILVACGREKSIQPSSQIGDSISAPYCLSTYIDPLEFMNLVHDGEQSAWLNGLLASTGEGTKQMLIHEAKAAVVSYQVVQKLVKKIGATKSQELLTSGVFMAAFEKSFEIPGRLTDVCKTNGEK
jgi:hypothetical protein